MCQCLHRDVGKIVKFKWSHTIPFQTTIIYGAERMKSRAWLWDWVGLITVIKKTRQGVLRVGIINSH